MHANHWVQLQRHYRRTFRSFWEIWAYQVRLAPSKDYRQTLTDLNRQIRQGTANNTKGTVFVVYEDVTDAKQACDKLNGFNFQNRYLVGVYLEFTVGGGGENMLIRIFLVLYHQPEKMMKANADIAERQETLEKLKQQHGID